VDYDPSLVKIKKEDRKKGEKLEGYLYKNKKGDKKHYFPESLTEETPILMENEEYQIKFVPIETSLVEEMLDIPVTEEDVVVVKAEEAEVQEETVVDIYEEESVQDIKTSYLDNDGKIKYQ
jgi:hypothetical protein